MNVTDDVASRIIRLPMWVNISNEQQYRVIEVLSASLKQEVAGL